MFELRPERDGSDHIVLVLLLLVVFNSAAASSSVAVAILLVAAVVRATTACTWCDRKYLGCIVVIRYTEIKVPDANQMSKLFSFFLGPASSSIALTPGAFQWLWENAASRSQDQPRLDIRRTACQT